MKWTERLQRRRGKNRVFTRLRKNRDDERRKKKKKKKKVSEKKRVVNGSLERGEKKYIRTFTPI